MSSECAVGEQVAAAGVVVAAEAGVAVDVEIDEASARVLAVAAADLGSSVIETVFADTITKSVVKNPAPAPPPPSATGA